jgi:hypothetical protein
MSWRGLKRLLLLFWAVWLSLVVAGNAADALKAAGVLPESYAYASGNYATILEVLAPFNLPAAFGGALFAGVILWEVLAGAMFWWAGLTFRGCQNRDGRGRLIAAFVISLGLWGAFQIACEALPSPLAYQLAGTHRLLFTETLATLLAIVLLPDE